MLNKVFRYSTGNAAGNPTMQYVSQSSSNYSGSFVSLQETSNKKEKSVENSSILDIPVRSRANSHQNQDATIFTEPVLPWMKSEASGSGGSSSNNTKHLQTPGSVLSARSSCSSIVDTFSLHTVKRQAYAYNNANQSGDMAASAEDGDGQSVVDSINEKRKKYYQTKHPSKRRWTKHKWWLILINTLLFCYGLAGMLLALLTYFKFYMRADVVVVGQPIILRLILSTGVICLFTSLLGYTGIMLNNRCLLSFYNLLLWPCFGLIAAIGYTAYRKKKWNIEGKLSYQWHYDLSADGRSRIQANLHCCGYKSFTDYHERSNKCFPRTLLPGCRYKYQHFTKDMLTWTYIVAFSMVPVHLLVMISSLLCSNHINRKFGKGLPPKLYRLDYQGIVAVAAGEEAGEEEQEALLQQQSSARFSKKEG